MAVREVNEVAEPANGGVTPREREIGVQVSSSNVLVRSMEVGIASLPPVTTILALIQVPYRNLCYALLRTGTTNLN